MRGAGRPQGVLVMERMMDRMAETLGLDPAEARARNLIPADAFPYPVGMWFRDGAPLTYDSGDYPELLRHALELADYAAARREQARAARARAGTAGSASRSAWRAWGWGRSRARSCGSTGAAASS